MRNLNLDQIEALLEVVQLGSFSAAAERLSLTQPAVTQKIRALEQRYGKHLVRSIGKRTVPTDAGKRILTRAAILLGDAKAVDAEIRGLDEDTVQKVVIGAGATACIHLLPRFFQRLKRNNPQIEILVRTGTTAEILESMQSGTIDLAVVTGPVRSENFSKTLFCRDALVLVAPADTAIGKRVTPISTPSLPLILYERGSATSDLVLRWLAKANEVKRLHASMEMDSTEAIKRLIASGLGWSILPQACVSSSTDKSQFVIGELQPRLARDLILVRSKGRTQNPGVETVWNVLSSGR